MKSTTRLLIPSFMVVLFLTLDEGGLLVVDISDPLSPRTVTRLDVDGRGWGMTFQDDSEAYGICGDDTRLIIGDLQRSLQMWDVSNPERPQILATCDEFGCHDAWCDGDYIYVTSGDPGFNIFRYVNAGGTLHQFSRP